MSWKNLHFRPPILNDKTIDGKGSDLLLIRSASDKETGLNTTFAGYILLRESDNSNYYICGRGCKVHKVISQCIEWTEVPE